MKAIITLLALLTFEFSMAQRMGSTTVFGFNRPYYLTDYKIYEDTTAKPAKLVATIKGNKIYTSTSTQEKDVLYTVVGDKVYKTGIINPGNLLFYIKGDEIFLRTKKGSFKSAGLFSRSGENNELTLLAYLEPLEYFAFGIAIKRF